MNIKKWLSKIKFDKKYVLIAAGLWLLVSYSMFLAYEDEWFQARIRPKYISTYQNLMDSQDKKVFLSNNMKISQSIKIDEEEISGIALCFVAEQEMEKGTVTVEFLEKESNTILGSWVQEVEDIPTEDEDTIMYSDFVLNEELTIDKSSEYVINVSANGIQDDMLNITMVELTGESDVVMTVNGEKVPYVMEYKLSRGNHDILKYLQLAFYIGMAILVLTVVFMSLKNARIEWIFVAFVLIIGIMYMFLLPPYSVPDEASHFVSAYAQSSQLLGKEALDEEGLIIVADEKLWGSDDMHPNVGSYDKYFRGVLGIGKEPKNANISTRTPISMDIACYFPQVAGISVARILNFNSEQLLYCGRLFSLLWYVFVMYWAIRKIPFGKMALFAIGSFPMTMQMVISYNYDSVLFGVCFLVVAYLMELIFKDRKVGWKDVLFLTVSACIIAKIKFIYLPIMGLALFIPKEKFGSMKRKIVDAVFVLGVSGVTVLVQKISVVQKLAAPHVTNALEETEAISIGYMIEHPVAIVNLFFRTFEHELTNYLTGMVASPLGYLELWVPTLVAFAFIGILLVSIWSEPQDRRDITLKIRIVSFVFAAIVAAMAFTAIICDCTPLNSQRIVGFQGRYLLPALPLAIILLKNKKAVISENVDKYLILFLSYLHCFMIFYISLVIVGR